MYQRRNQKRKKYFGLYENKELLYLCNVAKTVVNGTFIVLNSYITKKISNLKAMSSASTLRN